MVDFFACAKRTSGEGKRMNIFITGGTSGIGRCAVETLTTQGHNVTFVGRNSERGAEVSSTTGATFVQADLTQSSECERVTEEYFSRVSHCDALVNNAGLWTQGNLIDADVSEIHDVFAINTLSPVILTRYFLTHLSSDVKSGKQTGARIVFVNSMAGLSTKAERSVYFATKWAITGFARSLALELAPENIAVTNLCPGYINTELFDHGGYPRDASEALDPVHVAEAISHVISLPDGVHISEMTIKPTQYI